MARKKTKQHAITTAEIEQVIHVVRGQRVLLDSNLAKLYGVTTGRLNEQLAPPDELVEQLTKLAETVQLHDEQIKVVTQVLKQMLEKPDTPEKQRIGFHRRGADD